MVFRTQVLASLHKQKGDFQMKKWLTFLMVAMLALVLAACTANKDAGKDTGKTGGHDVDG